MNTNTTAAPAAKGATYVTLPGKIEAEGAYYFPHRNVTAVPVHPDTEKGGE